MEESKKFLLALVRTALWGREESLPQFAPNWSEVLALAHKQTLVGLVADVIPLLPDNLKPDAQMMMKIHSVAMRIIQAHSLLNRKVADIKTRLDSYGMQTVLFKGQGTALNYPKPYTRQCGDIDLYVGEKKFEQALNLLDPTSEKKAVDYKYVKHFNIEEDGVSIEIHRIAETLPVRKYNKLFQQWTVDNLEGASVRRVEIGGATVNLPPADFDAIYIMNHAWHHFINGGIGLRQLCDWTMHLHCFHNNLDKNILEKRLQSFGLIRAWKILSCVAVKYLGLPAEECPLYDGNYISKAEKVLDVIWQEGNFGHHSPAIKTPRPKGHFAGKLFSFKRNTSRIIRIMSISPMDVIYSWIHYFINGLRNVFNKVG